MTGEKKTILFLCTGNSARSIMAEAVTNTRAGHRFAAYSAGAAPTGAINPHVAAFLEAAGHDIGAYRSKSWEVFLEDDAPAIDIVITVCDSAHETCPAFPGRPTTAHWGLADPAEFTGGEAEIRAQVGEVYGQIVRRVELLAALPMETFESSALKDGLQRIHDTDA